MWHFLGAVQRNKVQALAPIVGLWQSVAREAEGARIARFAPGASVLVQVDTTGLPGRNGCPPPEVGDLVRRLADLGLDVRGLMTVAAPGPAAAREAFTAVGRLADQLGLEERSMGMSDDLEAAVAAGTTMVRVGRALFGERPAAAPEPESEPRVEADVRLMGSLTSPGALRADLPGVPSRHYAVARQEKACHPRS